MTTLQTYRASTFKVERSPAAWQRALASLPAAHPLQSWPWAQFKSRWGWQPIPLLLTVAEGSWEPLAAAMVLKRPLPALSTSILYVPKGPALNYNDGALRRQVLQELEKLARRERSILVKIDPDVVRSWGLEVERPSPVGAAFTGELKERGWRFSREQIQFRNTVVVDLTCSEEALLAAMKTKTRYNVRLAGRRGVTVRLGDKEDLAAIATMYHETAARDNFTVRPQPYLLDAWQSLFDAGMAQPLLAEYEGAALAALILVRFGQRVIYMYGASSDRERQRMPNYLLQWEAIRWARSQGSELYDLWGAPNEFVASDPLWGVWRFKAGFNGQVVRHIGAWDYVARPLWHWLYSRLLPRYLATMRRRQEASRSGSDRA